jgi:hypothetical protein
LASFREHFRSFGEYLAPTSSIQVCTPLPADVRQLYREATL